MSLHNEQYKFAVVLENITLIFAITWAIIGVITGVLLFMKVVM